MKSCVGRYWGCLLFCPLSKVVFKLLAFFGVWFRVTSNLVNLIYIKYPFRVGVPVRH